MKLTQTPSLEENGWELESAEERNSQAPETFTIPSESERCSLKLGQSVQLLFLFNVGEDDELMIQCERMWVKICEVAECRYEGVLEHGPATSEVVDAGDIVSFGPEHVSSVMIPATDPRHPNFKREV